MMCFALWARSKRHLVSPQGINWETLTQEQRDNMDRAAISHAKAIFGCKITPRSHFERMGNGKADVELAESNDFSPEVDVFSFVLNKEGHILQAHRGVDSRKRFIMWLLWKSLSGIPADPDVLFQRADEIMERIRGPYAMYYRITQNGHTQPDYITTTHDGVGDYNYPIHIVTVQYVPIYCGKVQHRVVTGCVSFVMETGFLRSVSVPVPIESVPLGPGGRLLER